MGIGEMVKISAYPETDLVILAGGQAQRMQGKNKLLQKFDQDIQLMKIYQAFTGKVAKIWINSHRDVQIYHELLPEIQCFQDDQDGFLGPLMGIKSAWSHVVADFILFIPCDITVIPEDVVAKLHQALSASETSQVAFVRINQHNLYPFCLMKRQSITTIQKHLENSQLSLRNCFDELHPQQVCYENTLHFHSINSEAELTQYHQELPQYHASKIDEFR